MNKPLDYGQSVSVRVWIEDSPTQIKGNIMAHQELKGRYLYLVELSPPFCNPVQKWLADNSIQEVFS